jgi:integrase
MSIHTRKDGTVFVKYYEKMPDGSRKERREYFGKKPGAEQQAHERNDELKAGGAIAQYDRQTRAAALPQFKDLAAEYLAAKTNDMSPKSASNLFYSLSKVILPEIGYLHIDQITPHRLDQYAKKRLKTNVTKWVGNGARRRRKPVKDADGNIKKISKTSVHRELSNIIAVLNWAADPARKYIPKNPVSGYKKPKRDDQIIRPPDSGEIKEILKHAPAHLKRALLINYYTGLRPGNAELHGMQWYDVDWYDKTILVRSALKGGPVKRAVAIHPALFKLLLEWKEEDEGNDHPYIIHWKGKRVNSLKRSFATAKKKAKISRRIRPYDFRHAAITQMILNGDLKAASETAGHSNIEITIKQYEHITSKIKRDTVDSIEEIDV